MTLGFRSGKHPHEVLYLAAGAIMGLIGLLAFDHVASTTLRALPFPWGHVLYGGFFLGSVVSLVGVFLRSLAGALIERAGLFSLGIFFLTYAVVVTASSGVRALGFTVFMAAFAVANFVRVRQIGREVDEMQAARIVLGTRDVEE